MPRALTVCSSFGCTAKIPQGQGRCSTCKANADKARRPEGNPYATKGHQRFRREVLDRDPICVLCELRASTVADHYPTERRDLVDQGLDPDDPDYGRGLCAPCHAAETAERTPGGWNERTA